MSATVLWIIAAILVIAGIITLISGSIIWGIVLIVLGLLVGPGRRQHLPASHRRQVTPT